MILVAVIVGGGFLANFMSKMARNECGRQCPEVEGSVKVMFSAGPVEFALCRCPEDSAGHGN